MTLKHITPPLLGLAVSGWLFVSLAQAAEPTTAAATEQGMGAMPMEHDMHMGHEQMRKMHEAMMAMPVQTANGTGEAETGSTAPSGGHEQHHTATP